MPLACLSYMKRPVANLGLYARLCPVLVFVIALIVWGCGGGGGGSSAGSSIAVQIVPISVNLVPGGTKTFVASVSGTVDQAVTWTCAGGTIDQGGNYTAPNQSTNCTVTATSVAFPNAKATAQVTVVPATGIQITVAPTTASTTSGGQVQFVATVTGTTNTAVTWSASHGTIDSTGLYTAPTASGTYVVTATCVADNTKKATASVSVTAGSVQILPGSPSLGTNESLQFTATVFGSQNQAVTWSATGGTITTGGLYTAGTTPGSYHITATSVASPLSTATIIVTVNPVTLTVTPNPTTVVTGQKQQFMVRVTGANNKTVTWTTTAGTITSAGLLTAPTSATTLTVTATSVADQAVTATSAVTVVPPSEFFYDFNNGVPGVWTPTTNESTPSGVKFLGRISGTNAAQLVLDNLTTHTSLSVTFDLYVIGGWQGTSSSNNMAVTIGGTSAFNLTFSNVLNMVQSYPDGNSNAPGTGATGTNTLGYTSDPPILYNDSTYHITCSLPHTASSVTIVFTGNLTGTLSAMSWGLKNVDVKAVP